MTEHAPGKEQSDAASALFPVVGIGASAGGVRALQDFFAKLPVDTGMVFVVVMHLAPDQESHLAAVLQNHTAMPVLQVHETVALKPNHVYVIPPNHNLALQDAQIRLLPLETERRARAPIDHFLRTLADTHATRAIGIILSGAGSDGAIGLRRIKEVGGLTLVQDPVEAESDTMPRSAIVTGAVDLVLPVAQMPAKLIEYIAQTSKVPMPSDKEDLPRDEQVTVQKILTFVRAQSGHDFVRYKNSTILRRIKRRMLLHGLQTLPDYLKYLQEHQEEANALFADFLITVTNFFRDPEAFALLEQEVIPAIFQGKGKNDQVRVWVVGCATGEEAYSLGILLLEHAHQLEDPPRVQIFATDLSEEALRRGREGFYLETIALDVSPERLARFFTKEQGGYRVKRELRDSVLFAAHNLLKDPPFSRLDLISCRNVLIYLQRAVQQQLFELFHYALVPNGHLLLGSAETADSSPLFRDVNRRCSIFRRADVEPDVVRLPSLPVIVSPVRFLPETSPSLSRGPTPAESLHIRLLEQCAPPRLVVNANYTIVYFSEGVTRYLRQPRGAPTNQVLQRVHTELRTELTTALYRAFEHGEASESKAIPVHFNGSPRRVVLEVRLAGDAALKGFVLVFFHEYPAIEEAEAEGAQSARLDEQTVHRLEEELQTTRQRWQSTIEDYAATKEEMKAANEELQSMNEELRSTTEELETSKEELQSTNEELLTVNEELQQKIAETLQAHSDLQNLFVATDIATLFLDRELRVVRYTPPAATLFNFIPPDRGRPLGHLRSNLRDEQLEQDARAVLQSLIPLEREVESQNDQWFLMRIRPYRTPDDRIDGVAITFVDITERRRFRLELQAAKEYAEQIIHTIGAALLVLTPEWRVQMANSSFYTLFKVTPAETLGQELYQLGNRQWDMLLLCQQLNAMFQSGTQVHNFEVTHDFERIGRRTILINARRIDELQSILMAIEDITERKQAEERFQRVVEYAPNGMVIVDSQDKIVLVNAQVEVSFGYGRDELLGQTVDRLIPRHTRFNHAIHRANYLAEPKARPMGVGQELWGAHKDGHLFPIEAILTPIETEDGLKVLCTVVDITERKAAEAKQAHLLQEIENHHERLRSLNQQLAMVQETERKELARELHDRLGQNLTALHLTLALVQNQLTTLIAADNPVQARIGDAQGLVAQMTDQIRDVMAELRPPTLDDYGLLATLQWYANRLMERSALLFHVQGPEDAPRLGESVEMALFRIAQEAINNIVKHAAATEVTITLDVDEAQIRLTIADNGNGQAPVPTAGIDQTQGWGLLIMQERATAIGGQVQIKSLPGAGTVITVEVER
ncbi:MAG: chemotaxis protein CheB [Caldilineaceae bacterium]